tara:strand:- start:134 stop:799 length:666 start_codon:yes stop_codon:yes gene_type:complete
MKIAVCMFYDDNIKEYSDITRSINDIYCRKHGIDLIVSKTARKSERKPHWERIYLILEHLSNYDYMVWIDSDAFFYEDSKHIMELITKHDIPFIFSRDLGNQKVNTGVFIVKNTQYSVDFLTKWGYDDEIYDHTILLNNLHDQDGLDYMFDKNIMDISNHSHFVDYGVLQHFYIDETFTPYIFHMSGKKKDIRIRTSRFYLNKIQSSHVIPDHKPKSFKMF